jgi:glycosyltransferase involved in cell wall biosynthesis
MDYSQPESSLPFGVNIAGYLTAESGLGQAARLGLHALACAGIPHAANNVPIPELQNNETIDVQFDSANPYMFNLVWVNVDQADHFAWSKGKSYFRDHYNIGFWAWETPEFPTEWLPHFQYYNEIWVPSSFVHDIISRQSPVPVVRVPHPVLPREAGPDGRLAARNALGIPEGAFVFSFVFHFHSSFERKNPLALIKAFKAAFSSEPNAYLVIKCAAGEKTSGLGMLRQAARDTNVRVVNGTMSRSQLNALFETSDCYVSLHRSEGFGLTMAEAMTYGKPVIATGYGGNTDFMKPHNSLLIDYELVRLQKDTGAYRKGWLWAEPKVEHAAELMRFIFEQRDKAAEIGERGRQEILAHFSTQAVGELMRQRLTTLCGRRQPASLDGVQAE